MDALGVISLTAEVLSQYRRKCFVKPPDKQCVGWFVCILNIFKNINVSSRTSVPSDVHLHQPNLTMFHMLGTPSILLT